MAYNVRGLASNLDNKDFVSYVENFDIICLTETHFKADFELKVWADFDVFIADAHKLSKHGRLAGGVMILVRKLLSHLIEKINVDLENIVVLKMKKDLMQSEKDIILIGCYLPPIDSKFWSVAQNGTGFDVIEKCVLCVCEKIADFHLMLFGDFNARTGNRNSSSAPDDFDILSVDNVTFQRSSQDNLVNEYGEQLLEFCNTLDCIILNGLSSHKFDDSCTFISALGSSVIDYFIISRELFNKVEIISLKIENRLESDHLPVTLTINTYDIQLKREQTKDEYVKKIVWDVNKVADFITCLNSEEAQTLLDAAQNCLETDIDKALDLFTNYMLKASECMKKNICTTRKRKGAPWYDKQCRELKILVNRKLRVFRRSRQTNDREDYIACRNNYKKLIREKRNSFRRNQAAILASDSNNPSTFWSKVRSLISGRKADSSNRIDLLTWQQHFETLFKQNDCINVVILDETPVDNGHTLNAKISEQEILEAINKLKIGKAEGIDGILTEMLKASKPLITNFLTILFNTIFDKGQYPSHWAKAVIVPIFKKGSEDSVDNYRGISLLSILSKCFTFILNKRLYNWLEREEKIVENQAGFRRNYCTTDHIFTLYAIIQSCLCRKGRKLYVAFVDFKKAFDSVHHGKLLETLQREGINGKFFCILKSMYEQLKSCVRVGGKFTDFFECHKGVRQGCVLSPSLFSLFINRLAEHVSESGRHGVQLLPGLMELFILLFADDVTLLATTPSGLQNQLNCLRDCCKELNLEVNIEKTKIMVFRKGGFLSSSEKWNLNGVNLEIVNEYCYLGFVFTTMLSCKNGTKHLASKGKKAVFNLNRLLQQMKTISVDTFFKIFDSKVQSILLYSSEIWGLNRLDSIEKVHLQACKHFLGVPSCTPNKMIYCDLGRYPLYINSAIRTLKYWLRIVQLPPNRLPNQAYHMLLALDNRGKYTWTSCIRQMLSSCGFYYVWLQQNVGNVKMFLTEFKVRLQDIFKQELFSTIRDRTRYEFFRSFKTDFSRESYLVDIDVYCFRIALSLLRMGVLPINNNLFRFSDNAQSRNCLLCKDNLENEYHFLYVCPLYTDLRNRFLADRPPCLSTLFRWKDPVHVRSVAKYVYFSFEKRKKSFLPS